MKLALITDGRVILLPDDGDGRILGHVLEDDYNCPPGLEAEWAALADSYLEQTEEGRAERDLWRQEYHAMTGALR